MTKDEFIAIWTQGDPHVRSFVGVNVWPIPCDCGQDLCQGWQMTRERPVAAPENPPA